MKFSILLVALLTTSATAFSSTTPHPRTTCTSLAATSSSSSRRELLWSFGVAAATALAVPNAANALDMDAFANQQIEADQKNCNPKLDPKCAPVLTADEALCKYGQSGTARGEACRRVKAQGGELPSSKPAGKSLGGAYAM
jgi:hypothetical protein